MWQQTTKPNCQLVEDQSNIDPEESFRGNRWICPETRERFLEVLFVANAGRDGYSAVEPRSWLRWVESTHPITEENPDLIPD